MMSSLGHISINNPVMEQAIKSIPSPVCSPSTKMSPRNAKTVALFPFNGANSKSNNNNNMTDTDSRVVGIVHSSRVEPSAIALTTRREETMIEVKKKCFGTN